MSIKSILAVALLVVGSATPSCAAVVTYSFTSDASMTFITEGDPEKVSGTFTVNTSGSQPEFLSASLTLSSSGNNNQEDGTYVGPIYKDDNGMFLYRVVNGVLDQRGLVIFFDNSFGLQSLIIKAATWSDPFFNPPLFLTAGDFTGSAQIAATPLPAALPLFATGLGAIGLLGWRRKRKAAAAIAAA